MMWSLSGAWLRARARVCDTLVSKNLGAIILITIYFSPKIWAENLNSFERLKIWAQILAKMNDFPLNFS